MLNSFSEGKQQTVIWPSVNCPDVQKWERSRCKLTPCFCLRWGGPPAPVVGHWFYCHDQQVITFLTFQFPFQSQHKGYRCLTCQINSWCTCLIFICIFECILQTNHQYIFLLISFLIFEGWSFLMEDCAFIFPFCPPDLWFTTSRCWLDWSQTKQLLRRPISRPLGCVTNHCSWYVTSVIDRYGVDW